MDEAVLEHDKLISNANNRTSAEEIIEENQTSELGKTSKGNVSFET